MSAYTTADSTAPAFRAAAINLAADTSLEVTRNVYVGGAGDVKVDMQHGETVTFKSVPAGTFMPIQVSKIYSTANGTTATNLLALY